MDPIALLPQSPRLPGLIVSSGNCLCWVSHFLPVSLWVSSGFSGYTTCIFPGKVYILKNTYWISGNSFALLCEIIVTLIPLATVSKLHTAFQSIFLGKVLHPIWNIIQRVRYGTIIFCLPHTSADEFSTLRHSQSVYQHLHSFSKALLSEGPKIG